jgi:hypothetical protein
MVNHINGYHIILDAEIAMGKLTLTLNDELEKKFRDEIYKRLGMKKGNMQIAIEEAIELWIKGKKA